MKCVARNPLSLYFNAPLAICKFQQLRRLSHSRSMFIQKNELFRAVKELSWQGGLWLVRAWQGRI